MCYSVVYVRDSTTAGSLGINHEKILASINSVWKFASLSFKVIHKIMINKVGTEEIGREKITPVTYANIF